MALNVESEKYAKEKEKNHCASVHFIMPAGPIGK